MRNFSLTLLIACLFGCANVANPGPQPDIVVAVPPGPSNDIVVSWTTDVDATGVVELGTEKSDYTLYAYTAGEKLTRDHEITVIGLEPDTEYFYRARSITTAGEILTSFEESVRTKSGASTEPLARVHLINISDRSPGDAILIETADQNVLIDGGGQVAISRVRDYVESLGIGSIDLAMITHDHWDHCNGLAEGLLDDLNVQAFVAAENNVRESQISDVRAAAAARGVAEYRARRGHTSATVDYLKWSPDVFAEIISAGAGAELATGHEGTDINNDSIVLKLTVGEAATFLFTGDAEDEVNETYVMDTTDEFDVDVDLLKVGHHGRADANSLALFDALSPTIGFISTHNSGLLHQTVMWDLRDSRTDVFRNDLANPNSNRTLPDQTGELTHVVAETDGRTIVVRH